LRRPLPPTFTFKNVTLRTVELDGQTWFVAADVCRCLGMNAGKGVTNWKHLLLPDERRLLTRREQPVVFKGSNAPTITLFSESALYKVLLRAQRKSPEVAEFQDWVANDVLPSIRKTGGNGSFLRLANYPSLLEGGYMEGVYP
jgi:prophage antirepressor-like protein